jgi:hypothetical protein
MKRSWSMRAAARRVALAQFLSGRMLALVGCGLALLPAALPLEAAEGPRAVVELFTSQGCSSCPPADALIGDLAKQRDLIVITMPVDYWDYLGWKDTLADPAFTARQKGYAKARGDGQVYTPQVVVNGLAHAVGSDRAAIEAAAATTRAQPGTLSVPVSVSEGEGKVSVTVGAADGTVASATLWLAPLVKSRAVAIGRGENSGRNITYSNVARALTRLADWTGRSLSLDVPLGVARPEGTDGYVVVLQTANAAGKPGVIVGAAKGPGL